MYVYRPRTRLTALAVAVGAALLALQAVGDATDPPAGAPEDAAACLLAEDFSEAAEAACSSSPLAEGLPPTGGG
ncbi:hypothetical protein [Allostreptomyces psammosilenae]|uniref:Uncharacterized protein n=1 Tax=Allostreptomyces psammosilenae TaxID=1892865 RepID=A0A853A2M1_9ACTN|nr:hypothetical protein [Allostreptomyces psammosilenae]NYI04762.1 hypothetical protein [Allostreptomyces psammosilenae]